MNVIRWIFDFLAMASCNALAVSPQSVSNALVEELPKVESEQSAGDPVGLVTGSVYERACDLAVTNEWPNREFVKAWKVIEANTTNVVDTYAYQTMRFISLTNRRRLFFLKRGCRLTLKRRET